MTLLQSIQIIISVILITLILMQQRGTALGGAFGGEGNVYRTRRGVEKFLHWGTIIFSLAFLAMTIINLVV